jgi:hypothetical protein
LRTVSIEAALSEKVNIHQAMFENDIDFLNICLDTLSIGYVDDTVSSYDSHRANTVFTLICNDSGYPARDLAPNISSFAKQMENLTPADFNTLMLWVSEYTHKRRELILQAKATYLIDLRTQQAKTEKFEKAKSLEASMTIDQKITLLVDRKVKKLLGTTDKANAKPKGKGKGKGKNNVGKGKGTGKKSSFNQPVGVKNKQGPPKTKGGRKQGKKE